MQWVSRVLSRQYRARNMDMTRIIYFCLSISYAAVSTSVFAAENIATPVDSNSRITVENAVVKGDETTVFFLTYPDRGDPNSGKPCPLNYYSVKLRPGLPDAKVNLVAKGVCSGLMQKSRLLDNGDALMIVGGRLERWRAGKQIDSQAFSSLDAASTLRISTGGMGAQFYDISQQGDVVLALPSGGFSESEFPDTSMVMTSLSPDGKRRWQTKLGNGKQGSQNTPKQVWAGSGGSAMLYTSMLASGLSPAAEAQLHFVNAQGSTKLITLNKSGEAMDLDLQGASKMSLEDLQKKLQRQNQSTVEEVKSLGAVARKDGGFDVLFQLKGRGEGREGFFLYRFGSSGDLQSEIPLGNHIELHGLERWFDFYIEGKQLLLLSQAPVTQKVVRNVKRGWGQNIVSWIDLDTGIPTARLLPLDERYLEAAMNAGDEGQQYLAGQPGSEPELLTTLNGKPLVVSVGWIAKRQVVRVHEADENLMAFTEIADERQAELAKKASRKQRSADREAQSQRMNAAMAEAAGMSEKEFNALSNREQKEALIRSGNSDQLLGSMMRESEAMQAKRGISSQNTPQQQAGIPQDTNAQIAAAMAQAQAQMANDPHMTPEMRAQMATIMAQMGGGQAANTPAVQSRETSQKAAGKQPALAENTLNVDSGKRGFIEFENADGRLMTLLIFNRQTGKELMKKDYPDGVIYEYVDFSQFDLPLERIGVLYREVSGLILKDLTPVVSQ
jgi:hypothetical protein